MTWKVVRQCAEFLENETLKPSSDSDSKLDGQAKKLRREWFRLLPYWDSDGVIEKEFNTRYTNNTSKRKALEGAKSNHDIPF